MALPDERLRHGRQGRRHTALRAVGRARGQGPLASHARTRTDFDTGRSGSGGWCCAPARTRRPGRPAASGQRTAPCNGPDADHVVGGGTEPPQPDNRRAAPGSRTRTSSTRSDYRNRYAAPAAQRASAAGAARARHVRDPLAREHRRQGRPAAAPTPPHIYPTYAKPRARAEVEFRVRRWTVR